MSSVQPTEVRESSSAQANLAEMTAEPRQWYTENVAKIPEGARQLLQNYSGLEPEEVIPHVVSVVRVSSISLGSARGFY